MLTGNFPGTGPEPNDLLAPQDSVTNLLKECAERNGVEEIALEPLWRLLYKGTKQGMQEETECAESAELPPEASSLVDQMYRTGPDIYSRRIVNREMRPGKASRIDFRKGWVDVVLEMVNSLFCVSHVCFDSCKPFCFMPFFSVTRIQMHFQPHLVIISAGFDAHRLDPLANCQLTEVDFGWATALVKEVRDVLTGSCVSKRRT